MVDEVIKFYEDNGVTPVSEDDCYQIVMTLFVLAPEQAKIVAVEVFNHFRILKVIRSHIDRARNLGEWYDVDTIGHDIQTELGIDPDTEEIYNLICDEIDK